MNAEFALILLPLVTVLEVVLMEPSFPHAQSPDSIRTHLEKVLQSAPFSQSHRLCRLLRYLVEAHLDNTAHRIKGYTLAVEVFDKDKDFDPESNALVRVEMGRLRGKLTEYYAQAGDDVSLTFGLPKGKYQITIAQRPYPVAQSMSRLLPGTGFRHPGLDAGQPSIAVMPFDDLSADQDQGWFAEGLAEDVIADLSKISGLRVCGRHAWRHRDDHHLSPVEIGLQLGVRHVLHGSVRREGERTRLSATLIETIGGNVVWSERYDRMQDNSLTLQSELSAAVVQQLRLQLTPLEEERLGHLGTAHPQAYEAFLKGSQHAWRYSEADNFNACQLFDQALALDSQFVAARAMLARSLVYDYTMRWNGSDTETLVRASQLAEQAIAQDGLHPLPHAILGWIRLWQADCEAAVATGQVAVALDPNSVDARTFLSIALCLSNRAEEGLLHSEIALLLNPAPTAFHLWANAMNHLYTSKHASAVDLFTRGIEVGPGFLPNHIFRIHALVESERLDDARAAAKQYARQVGNRQVSMRSPIPDRPGGPPWMKSMQVVGLLPS